MERKPGRGRWAAACLALVVLTGGAGPADAAASGSRPQGCTAWGVGGVGQTTCSWLADRPGGGYGIGRYSVRVYRDGLLVRDSGAGHPVGCFPGTIAPLYGPPSFVAGDLVEVEVDAGYVHVGPLGGVVC